MDKTVKILDYGELGLIDIMGSDDAIVEAARVSYGKGTKQVSSNRSLIRYLMRHQHWGPFEMAEMKFYVKLPIFVARQWVRHRTASINEISGRYSEFDMSEVYRPTTFRKQSQDNKQGSSDSCFSYEIQSYDKSQTEYSILLNKGAAKELARIVLPVSSYTQWYWKCDLRNIFNFLRLRLDFHAQYEIRMYAQAMAKMVKESFPLAYEAFEDYILNSVTFNGSELRYINWDIVDGGYKVTIDFEKAKEELGKRELNELRMKLRHVAQ